jgi:hypothetical protein
MSVKALSQDMFNPKPRGVPDAPHNFSQYNAPPVRLSNIVPFPPTHDARLRDARVLNFAPRGATSETHERQPKLSF